MSLQDIRTHVLCLINEERRTVGEFPLVLDDALNVLAQGWAVKMASDIGLSHGDFAARINSVYPNTFASENISNCQSQDTVVSAWMDDAAHRYNMLGNYTKAGIGYSEGYWCLDLVR